MVDSLPPLPATPQVGATIRPRTKAFPSFYYGYWLVGAGMVAQFVATGTDSLVGGVFLVPMTEDLGWARAEYAYALTAGRFVMAFVGFFLGAYLDRWGGRRFMLIGGAILGTALFSISEITTLWQWILLKGVVSAIGAALVGNLVVSVMLSKWFVEKRGRVISISAMGTSAAGVLLPPLANWLIQTWDWRMAWRLLAVGAMCLLYPVAMLVRRQPEDRGLHPDGRSDDEIAHGAGLVAAEDFAGSLTRREALHTRALYLIVLAFGLSGVGTGTMLLHTVPLLEDAGRSTSTAVLMSSIMLTPSFASKPLWGWLIDKWPANRLAAVGFVLSGSSVLVILASVNAGLDLPMVLGFLVMGLGFGGQFPLQETIWASYFGRRHLGSVRGAAMPLSLLLGAGGPLLVSFYFDYAGNYDGALITLSCLWGAAALLILTVRRPERPVRVTDTAALDSQQAAGLG